MYVCGWGLVLVGGERLESERGGLQRVHVEGRPALARVPAHSHHSRPPTHSHPPPHTHTTIHAHATPPGGHVLARAL